MSEYLDVNPDLLAGFLDEAPAYLTSLEDGLMAFEEQARDGAIALRNDDDHERMNEVFRAAHSFKGIAASLGFDKIRDLTHAMESLFDQLRMGKRELRAAEVETLFTAVDTLRQLIDELSTPVDPPVAILEPLGALNAILAGEPNSSPEEGLVQEDESNASPSDPTAVMLLTDDSELLARFVESTDETIDLLSQQLLALEKEPSEVEAMNEVFRCAHNIKGASSAVGCGTMSRLTHEMETVLDRVRSNEIAVDAQLISALFAAIDKLRSDLDLIRNGCIGELGADAHNDMFAAWSLTSEIANSVQSGSTSVEHQESDSHTLGTDGSLNVIVTFRKGDAEAPILACIIYNRLAESASSVESTPDVFSFEDDSEIGEICYRIVTGESSHDLERIVRAYEIEDVRFEGPSGSAPVTQVPTSSGQQSDKAPETAKDSATQNPESKGDRDESNLENQLRANAPVAPSPTPSPSGAPIRKNPTPSGNKVGETIRVDLERLDQLMNLGGELVITKARFTDIARRISTVFSHSNLNYLVDDMSDRLTTLRSTITDLSTSRSQKQIGVELSESILHLTDDFETIRGLMRRLHESRGAMGEFGEAVHSLNRISEGMQRRIMQTRMVPIGPLFQRFRRSVRDMCKATGKSVDLQLFGEATELDKRMIDELVDPLTHMVRNSVDHGIELPEDRRKAGKPETGKLELDAFHRGRHICIEVRDDGKGLDVDRIRRKIIERELAGTAQVDQMSDYEAMQYIFRAGFSTAEQVTDLSGRGMGMDIVRGKIEVLNGSVELNSTPGKGTRFTISLPLTLAIIPAMMAQVGKFIYAVPLEMVVEITTVARESIKHIQKQAVISLRDHVIPLTLLEHVLGVDHPEQRTRSLDEKSGLTVMILGFQNERIGLIVDDLIGQEDIVIKDVAANYQNVAGVAGASIMGDGTVSLILDVAALMSNFATRGAQQMEFQGAETDCIGAQSA